MFASNCDSSPSAVRCRVSAVVPALIGLRAGLLGLTVLAVGLAITALGVPERLQFDAASALVHHVLGVASQYDASRQLAGMAPPSRELRRPHRPTVLSGSRRKCALRG
jgi:hypothetical protein